MVVAAVGPMTFDLVTLAGPGPRSDWFRALGVSPIVLGDLHEDGEHGRFGVNGLLRLLRLLRSERYAALYVIGLSASTDVASGQAWLRGAKLMQGGASECEFWAAPGLRRRRWPCRQPKARPRRPSR